MPKIINKALKRRKIAQSACSLLIEKGFNDVSISEIAKEAKIGKGTIYEYFKNKEDIVIELMDAFQESYKQNNDLEDDQTTTKTKILNIFEIFYNEAEELKTQRKIYKLFLAIHLNSRSEDVNNYYKKFREKYLTELTFLVENSIENKKIKPLTIKLVPSIFATIEGFFIEDESDKIKNYIDTICNLISY